ncbi:hypothetical protein AB1I70_29920 [Bacillus mobilis]|uniref:Uncharacterized protein n=1 Tax=Bacillus mobilis TaxID=2026190 RepID=A0ABV4S2E8_9BACI
MKSIPFGKKIAWEKVKVNNSMMITEIRENSLRDKLQTILEKAANGDLEAIKLLEEINQIIYSN